MTLVALLCIVAIVKTRARVPAQPHLTGQKELHNPATHWYFGFARELMQLVNSGTMVDWYLDYAKKVNYECFVIPGPFGVRFYNVNTAEDVEHFMKHKFDSYHKGPDFHEVFKELLGDGIFSTDGEQWRTHRKVASLLFSANQLRNRMESVFKAKSIRVVEILRTMNLQQTVDVQNLFLRFTFDSICSIAFGHDVDSLGGNARDMQVQKAYDIAQSVASARFYRPFWKLERLLGLGSEANFAENIKIVNEYIYKIIDASIAQAQEVAEKGFKLANHEQDMLSLYLAHARTKGKTFSRTYLRDVVLNFIIAGRDTTAMASAWMVWRLAHHPEVEQKLLAEIDANVRSTNPTYNELKGMTYMHAFFLETLRLHPSVPIDGKFCKKADKLPCGLIIQPGDAVQFNPIVMNRNPRLWGDDAAEFKPERWLDAQGNIKEEPAGKYPTFNLAPRMCLGKHMAALEAKMLLVPLVRNFTFSPPGDDFKLKRVTSAILMAERIPVHITPRTT